ncbi:Sugar fermentation stimulation protein like protein [Saliniradius amylolyticus]|uniref:Sugar fermentation stimulation protein homolog n=1 Tax=Saliniradius amylolyticus TaxID=2183582 RepID=A0A2S2DZS5_9ALTE|nr:DNA/RNA nuclease SfsA [Saliniradius amylolyticus]AWL10863.1 Sugar fermentation stimulation protein like protein [Saliniradius amylolyticus]
MKFDPPLIRGKLIKRYKRFLADVRLENGEQVTAHCANTGAMTACLWPDYPVYLSYSDNPKRKLAYSWQLAQNPQGDWIGINTHSANKLVAEAVTEGRIPELAGYERQRSEVRYGEQNSRADLVLESEQRPRCVVEVKSVTLLDETQGYFPDTVTTRGQKHLEELISVVQAGQRAVLFFCVQHSGISSVKVAEHLDPAYARLFYQALEQGVEVLAYGCDFSPEAVVLNQPVPVNV